MRRRVNSVEDLERLMRGPDGQLRPEVFFITYEHAPNCPKTDGGRCVCDPDVYLDDRDEWLARIP